MVFFHCFAQGKNNHSKRACRSVRLDAPGGSIFSLCERVANGRGLGMRWLRRDRMPHAQGFRGCARGRVSGGHSLEEPVLTLNCRDSRRAVAVLAVDGSVSSRTRVCSRMVAMTSGFSTQGMTRSVPPHLGQVSVSMAHTRFNLESRIDANDSGRAGTVHRVNAFLPALAPMAMR